MEIKNDLNVKYIDFSERYLDAVVSLSEERIGTIDKHRIFLSDCKLAVDADDGRLLGFLLSHTTDTPSLAKEMRLTTDELEEVVKMDNLLYVVDTFVVQKYAEKNYLATELVRQGIDHAQNSGCHSAWSPLWIKKNGFIPSKNLMERLGFSYLKTAPMRLFYNRPDFRCIDCGGRCTCDDAIYYKTL